MQPGLGGGHRHRRRTDKRRRCPRTRALFRGGFCSSLKRRPASDHEVEDEAGHLVHLLHRLVKLVQPLDDLGGHAHCQWGRGGGGQGWCKGARARRMGVPEPGRCQRPGSERPPPLQAGPSPQPVGSACRAAQRTCHHVRGQVCGHHRASANLGAVPNDHGAQHAAGRGGGGRTGDLSGAGSGDGNPRYGVWKGTKQGWQPARLAARQSCTQTSSSPAKRPAKHACKHKQAVRQRGVRT